jgi:ELWxxDGT repeat protein
LNLLVFETSMKRNLYLSLLFSLIIIPSLAQQVALLKDINNSTNNYGSYPNEIVVKGTTIIFKASSPLYGEELYVSDGTNAGTTLLKDIRVGGQGSSPSYLTNIGGTIYFTANDGDHGYELWKTDGTTNGTVLVKDINPGPSSSSPQSFISFQSKIYFTASDDTNGRELWLSDGTGAGTSLAVDINSGNGSSSPSYLTVAGTVLMFNAYEPTKGYELYKWDGITPTVFDLYTGAGNSSSPSYLTYNGTLLVFSAYTSTIGNELWTFNPNTNATASFDYIAGTTGLNPSQLTLAGTTVFFNAYHSTYGSELWKFSGGTISLVQDYVLGTGSSYPGSITASHPTASSATGVYFQAYNGSYYGLYYSSGSAIHTQLVSTLSIYTIKAYSTGNTAIVSGYTAANGYELYKTTTSATTFISDIYPGANSSYPYGFAYTGTLYFSATDQAKGNELFSSDLTSVTLVKDINTATDSNVNGLTSTGSGFLFSANNGSVGQELWKTDLTTANTALFADVNSTAGAGSDPRFLGKVNTNYLYALNHPTYGVELWKTDGTTAPTLVKDIESGTNSSYPDLGVVIGSFMYFRAYTTANGYEIWKTDGTTAGTTIIDIIPGAAYSYPDYLTAVGNTLIFSAYTDNVTYDYEVYKIDAATGTPSLLKNINSTGSSYPSSYVTIGSQVFFVADDGVNGYELWVTDGTSGNTKNVKDINPSGASNPAGLTAVGSILYFQATDGVNGIELWKSDGTSVNTVLVKDIDGANTSSYPYNLTAVGSSLYFNAYQPTTGTELWKSDGTSAGTVIVQDLTAGTSSSSMQNLTNINGTLYFNADLGTGAKLYKTNGLSGGTFVTTSTGTAYDYPQNITYYNGKIVFTANTNSNGNEPLLVAAEPTAQPTALVNTARTATSLSFSFTAAAGSPDGYIVLRKATSAPANFPADGTVYTVGNTIGTSTVAAIGASTSFTDSGLSPLTTYYYAVYAYKYDGTTNIYRITSPLQNNNSTIAADPTAQPSGFLPGGITVSSYSVSYTAATGAPAGYIVLSKAGATAPTETPTDGSTYSVGASIGTAKVVYVGSALTFNESSIAAATTTSYAIFSYNGSSTNINYLTTGPLTGNVTTLTAEPNAQATAMVFSNVQSQSLTASYTAAAGTPAGYLVIRKQTSAPTGTPVDGTAYSVGDVLGDGVIAYVGALTTFNDSGLTPASTYFYQIYSFNGASQTINYFTTSPLTSSQLLFANEPTAQPTALQFSNVTASSFTVGFTAAGTPTGYIAIRKTGASPTGVPVDGTTYTVGSTLGDGVIAYVGTGTTFNETLAIAAFFYDIYAYNGTAASVNYLTSIAPLEGNLTVDTTAPVITNETVASINSGSVLDIIASVTENESQISSVSVDYKPVASSSTAMTTMPMVLTSGKWKFTVPANEITELGVEYKITATNSQSLNSNVSSKTTLTFTDQNVSFNSFGSTSLNFRIISVPLDLTSKSVNDVFGDDLGAYDKAKWRMFRYESGSTKELTGTSSIDLGKGYWLIVKDNKTIDTGPGKTAATSSTEPFIINLASGWNQIGNPYTFNVLWADVLSASGITGKLRTYGANGFVDGTKLNAFEGGFVFSNSAATLKFPVAKNPAAGRVQETTASQNFNSIDQSDWEVNFILRNGDISNRFGGVGMSNDASNEYDQYDDFTLPRFQDYLEINHNKSFLKTFYTKDVVPTNENHIWEFTVESSLSGITEMAWDNSYFGKNSKSIFLFDVEAQATIDMKLTTSYSFESTTSRKFKVVYGSETFVNDNALPEGLVINTVYPNPSESSVTIGITVPNYFMNDQTVVTVNSLLGQPVSFVYEGVLAPGYHELKWNGVDKLGQRPTQGLYLVEVKTGPSVKVKRLVIK